MIDKVTISEDIEMVGFVWWKEIFLHKATGGKGCPHGYPSCIGAEEWPRPLEGLYVNGKYLRFVSQPRVAIGTEIGRRIERSRDDLNPKDGQIVGRGADPDGRIICQRQEAYFWWVGGTMRKDVAGNQLVITVEGNGRVD